MQPLGPADLESSGLKEGDVVDGTIRSIRPYGAMVELAGHPGRVTLLHASQTSGDASALAVGQPVKVRACSYAVSIHRGRPLDT